MPIPKDGGRAAASRLDQVLIQFNRHHGLVLLRVALGVVFLWFGALKVADASPAAQLVAETLPLLPARLAVLLMGLIEMAVGIGLLVGKALRLTLFIFFAQMVGTLLTFVVHPGASFEDGNPLRLSMTGEFVLKNLVLITAGLAIVGTVQAKDSTSRLGQFTDSSPSAITAGSSSNRA